MTPSIRSEYWLVEVEAFLLEAGETITQNSVDDLGYWQKDFVDPAVAEDTLVMLVPDSNLFKDKMPVPGFKTKVDNINIRLNVVAEVECQDEISQAGIQEIFKKEDVQPLFEIAAPLLAERRRFREANEWYHGVKFLALFDMQWTYYMDRESGIVDDWDTVPTFLGQVKLKEVAEALKR